MVIVASNIPIMAAGAGEMLIEPSDAGCRVTHRQGMQPRRGARWLLAFISRGAPQELEGALGELRRLAETA